MAAFFVLFCVTVVYTLAVNCWFYVLLVQESVGMRDLSFPIRDETRAPALEVKRLSHWTAREGPVSCFCYHHNGRRKW